jgi:hypothetical protein
MIVAAKLFKKLNADALQKQIEIMQDAGVNQLYVFPEQVHKSGAVAVLEKSGIDVWLIAPIFFNDENGNLTNPVPKWAVCDDGETAQEKSNDGNWLKMVCPHDSEYMDYRIAYLKDALRKCHFTGVSLDFIRYFVFWESVFEDTDPNTLRNSCFCDICVNRFKHFADISELTGDTAAEIAGYIKKNHAEKWAEFKCAVIAGVTEKILADVRKEFPGLKANVHAVPWKKDDFGGAIQHIAGQNFSLLSRHVDQIAPMTYSKMLRRNGRWIHDVVSGIYNETGGEKVNVIPAIQMESVYGEDFNNSDFKEMLENSVKPPSSGVVIWQFEDLSGEQIEIIKSVLK